MIDSKFSAEQQHNLRIILESLHFKNYLSTEQQNEKEVFVTIVQNVLANMAVAITAN